MDVARARRRFAGVALLTVAAIGVLVIAIQWANARPLWLDEEMIALNFRDRSLSDLGGRLWLDQSAPLGWLALQRTVVLVFGSSELAVRAVPSLFGIGTVLLALYVSRQWLQAVGGLVFLSLCSFGQWISFYAVELKPYSADTFWALLLPAFAVKAADASSKETRRQAILIWMAAAALGHWFSLGALFVLPACCLLLAVRYGRQHDVVRLVAAAISLVSISVMVHFAVAIRFTLGNESLQEFWQFAYPPWESGVSAALRWLYQQLDAFALKPAGTGYAVAFWSCVVAGIVVARSRSLRAMMALVVASAFLFAALHLVPLYERLSLWFLPTLYLAIGSLGDRVARLPRPWMHGDRRLAIAAQGAALVGVSIICADVVGRGVEDLRIARPADSNRGTDDRSAVRWLMSQRAPGTDLITTRHALPGVWWYAGVPLTHGPGGTLPDGGRIFVAEYYDSAQACRGRELKRVLVEPGTAQLYLGFADYTPGFDDLLLLELSRPGTIVALRHFAGSSRAAVVDRSFTMMTDLFWEDAGKDTGAMLPGCVALRRAQMW